MAKMVDRFEERYGSRTLRVLRMLREGTHTDSQIRRHCRISKTSLAAYKANLTRGTYDPFVYVNARGRIISRV